MEGPIPEYILAQYLSLKEEQKRIEAELDNIKQILYSAGSFATENFVCAIREQERTSIKALAEVVKVLGLETLREYDLINHSKYRTIIVSKKDTIIL